MICPDVENKIFDRVYRAAITEFPNLDMDSIPNFTKCGDLACRLYEMDSQTVRKGMDLSRSGEHFKDVTYEVQIRSNLVSGKKQQAKAVYYNIKKTLIDMGLREISRDSFFEDTVYRTVARYRGRVDDNGNIS